MPWIGGTRAEAGPVRPPWRPRASPGAPTSHPLSSTSRLSPSVPFRKFDEEVLRTLRGLRPHPLPLALDPALPGCCAKRTRGALRRDWTTRPPTQPSVAERPSAHLRCAQRGASVATGGSARGGSQGGGGPSAPRLLQNLTPPPARLPPGNAHTRRGRPSAHLHCAARSAAQASLRAAARGSGVGVEDDHGRSACSRGAAVKLHVEITSRS